MVSYYATPTPGFDRRFVLISYNIGDRDLRQIWLSPLTDLRCAIKRRRRGRQLGISVVAALTKGRAGMKRRVGPGVIVDN